MSSEEILEYVKNFADNSHGNQVRKYTGERYIQHPLRVMELVRDFHPDTEVLAAALLHDVLEDTLVVEEEMETALLSVMPREQVLKVIQLVIDLTDIFIKKDYPRLDRRSRKEKEAARLSRIKPEAQSVKYADIIDNVTDIMREDADFAKVYVREAKRMLLEMKGGHPALREKAMTLVDKCLRDLPKPAKSY
jgi:guanosine-3',5'-bis(diphosphate) 3'-pyrophosphohydrolase